MKVCQQLNGEDDMDHHAQISGNTHARFRSAQEASLTSRDGLASFSAASAIKDDSAIDGLDPLALSSGTEVGVLRKTVQHEFKKLKENKFLGAIQA